MNKDYNSDLLRVLDYTEDAILSTSLDGTIQSWNKGSEKMFGYTSEEMIGKNISLLIPPESINDDKNHLSIRTNNEIVDRYETSRITKNGEQLLVALIVADLKDKASTIVGSYQVARDITSQKKSEAELIEAAKILAIQKDEKEALIAELLIANKELAFQNEEKHKRSEELIIANKELLYQIAEKEKRANELIIENEELAFQNTEKEKRAAELLIANLEIDFLHQEEHALFASIVDSSDDAMMSKRLDGIITSWNHGAEQIFGYCADEIIGKSILTLIPQQLQQEEIGIIEKIKNGEAVSNLKTQRVRKDGTVFFASLTISPIKNFDGNVIGASKVLRDITQQNQIELEKNQLAERLQLATKSARMGIWDWDIKNNVLESDEGMYKLYGIAAEDFNSVYDGWMSIIHNEDRQRIANELQLAIKNKKDYNTEFRVVWSDSSIHHIRATGIVNRDDDGNAKRMIGANWDVTAEKEKEHHLKLLESVITNTTDSILITEAEPFDEPGPRILYVNEAFTKMTGYTAEEVIGKTPRILQGPKSDKAELKRLGKAMRRWESCEITTINYKKNGEEFWINFSLTPVANEKGWFTHWIAIERDVTDQKIYISKLESQNLKLREIARSQSHIVRAPLARMMGIVSMLSDFTMDSLEYDEWVNHFNDSANELESIIKDIVSNAQTNELE